MFRNGRYIETIEGVRNVGCKRVWRVLGALWGGGGAEERSELSTGAGLGLREFRYFFVLILFCFVSRF